MSNALAIASVTRLLKDLINDALINGDISGDVGTDVIVTALPPDRAFDRMTDEAPSQLNLYLHRITSNAALSGCELPTRDARAGLTRRPRLALDLHYLLTAYTNRELHGEILLGYAMGVLHETPILAREMIRAALSSGVNGSILPPAFQNADPARLADQLELIKIAPQPLSMDDMSKLWTALQTSYRTTVAYSVSVVLIERELPVRAAPPVLSRGPRNEETGRDAGVAVRPDLAPPSLALAALEPPGRRPAIRLGDRLTLRGARLDEGEARVRFTEPESGARLELAPASAAPDRMTVDLPGGAPLDDDHALKGTGSDPGAWRVGAYLVDVATRNGGGGERASNRLPILLAPRATPSVAAEPGGARVTVGCAPRVRAGQALALAVGSQEQPIEAPTDDQDEVSGLFAGLPPATTLPVRLRVAGVDSILIDPEARPPRFDPTQMVTTP